MAAKQIYGPQKSPIANQIKKICKGSKSESLKFSFLAFSEATTEHKAQQIPPSIFHLLAVICSLLKSLFLLLWAFVSSRVLHWGHTQAAVGNSCTAFTAEATLPGAAIPKALHAIVTLPIAWGGRNVSGLKHSRSQPRAIAVLSDRLSWERPALSHNPASLLTPH